MALNTRLCDLLGTRVPIVQAPITGEPELALAVAGAGALGMVSLTWLEPAAIPTLMEAVGDATVAVNLVLEWPQDERVELALEHGARIVSLAWGDPAPFAERIHSAGAILLATAGTAEEARRFEAAGGDAVVAQGWEAGGHVWNEVATMVLVPAIVDAVDVPVIAAGGIADGRGIAAALALGADGAWLGTRFVASEEAPQLYKDRVLEATEASTVFGMIFSEGWEGVHRTIANAATAQGGTHPAKWTGDADWSPLYAGQSAGLVHDIKPAAEIVSDLVSETEAVLSGLAPGRTVDV